MCKKTVMFQGILMLQDHYRAIMQYSIPKELCPSSEKAPSLKASADWFCIKVGYEISMFKYLMFVVSSAELRILKGGIIVLNAMPREWKVKKVAAAAMKFAHTLLKVHKRICYNYI